MKAANSYENKKVLADRNKLCPGKNGGHKFSGLGCRLIVVGNEWHKILAVYKVLKFNNFNSKVCLGWWNGYIANADNFVPIILWPVLNHILF